MPRFHVLVPLCLMVSAVGANTLLVLPDGSGPYPDLQAAVAAAADGDTILLGDGVFSGAGNRNLVVTGRSLSFRSVSGASVVDLEGVYAVTRRFLECSGTLDDRVSIAGLELRNGSAVSSGGCIHSEGLALDLDSCVLRDSRADNWFGCGGAVYVEHGNLTVVDCVFANDQANYGQEGRGGAIATEDVTVAIHRTTFADNFIGSTFWPTPSRGGALSVERGTASIENCEFRGNRLVYNDRCLGGGVSILEAAANLSGCVFVDNESAGEQGGGGALDVGWSTSAVTNCTFVNNGAWGTYCRGTVYVNPGTLTLASSIITGAWAGGAAAAYNGTITATNCDVWGNGEDWTGPLAGQLGHDGNFSENPCFCDSAAYDFHLCEDSGCAPEQHGVLVGALPVGCEACDCPGDLTAVAATWAVPRLLGAAPNPFNPATVIRFTLPSAAAVRLTVHDLAGRRVATLVDGLCRAGEQSVTWRGRDDSGRLVAAGPYLLRLECAGEIITRKLTLLK